MFLEIIFHYVNIIFTHDYIPVNGGTILEDSPALNLAYKIAGL